MNISKWADFLCTSHCHRNGEQCDVKMYHKYVNFWLLTWIINTVGMHSVTFLYKKKKKKLNSCIKYKHIMPWHFISITVRHTWWWTLLHLPPSHLLLRVGSQSYSTCMRRQPIYSLEHKQSEGQNLGDWSEKICLQQSSLFLKTWVCILTSVHHFYSI